MPGKQPPPPPGSERRQFPRFDMVAQIELHRRGDVWLLQISDISAGGLMVELGDDEHAHVEIGDRVSVVLDLGDDSLRLEADADVARLVGGDGTKLRGFALMWVSSDHAFIAALARILEKTRA